MALVARLEREMARKRAKLAARFAACLETTMTEYRAFGGEPRWAIAAYRLEEAALKLGFHPGKLVANLHRSYAAELSELTVAGWRASR